MWITSLWSKRRSSQSGLRKLIGDDNVSANDRGTVNVETIPVDHHEPLPLVLIAWDIRAVKVTAFPLNSRRPDLDPLFRGKLNRYLQITAMLAIGHQARPAGAVIVQQPNPLPRQLGRQQISPIIPAQTMLPNLSGKDLVLELRAVRPTLRVQSTATAQLVEHPET